MSDQLARLQEQVDSLYHNLASLRSETLSLAPIKDRNLHPPPSGSFSASPASTSSYSHFHRPEMAHAKATSFRGPTSTAFSLDVANNTINTMGYRNMTEGDEPNGTSSEDVGASVRFQPDTGADPLWEYGRDEMIRLCRVHGDELGIMYPVLRIDSVIEHARKLTATMERARIQGTAPPSLDDNDTLQLKMIMCCALAVEGHGHSERAVKLYDSMESIINRKLMTEPCNVKSLPVLAALAGYRFVSNDEVLAWRVVGQVARLCIESGIHQRAGLMKIENEEDRRNALHSFWSAYVLDRRWAFATGLPYTVQDEDLDPELPMPVSFDSPLLLSSSHTPTPCATDALGPVGRLSIPRGNDILFQIVGQGMAASFSLRPRTSPGASATRPGTAGPRDHTVVRPRSGRSQARPLGQGVPGDLHTVVQSPTTTRLDLPSSEPGKKFRTSFVATRQSDAKSTRRRRRGVAAVLT